MFSAARTRPLFLNAYTFLSEFYSITLAGLMESREEPGQP
jgi:hypothetical protein